MNRAFASLTRASTAPHNRRRIKMFTKHWMKLGLALAALGCLPACQQSALNSAPAEEAETVGSAGEALGVSCWRAAPDDTVTGGVVAPGITTPTTYDNG